MGHSIPFYQALTNRLYAGLAITAIIVTEVTAALSHRTQMCAGCIYVVRTEDGLIAKRATI